MRMVSTVVIPAYRTDISSLPCKFGLPATLFIVYSDIEMMRKNLDTAVVDFSQAIGLFMRRLRAAGASHDLSWTEAAVMSRLAKDGPATTADLARAEGMKPQSMGATISALEEMGIVERKPHPTDGRQMNIQLTHKGAAMRASIRDSKRTWLGEAIAGLDERDRETLFAAGEIIRRLVQS